MSEVQNTNNSIQAYYCDDMKIHRQPNRVYIAPNTLPNSNTSYYKEADLMLKELNEDIYEKTLTNMKTKKHKKKTPEELENEIYSQTNPNRFKKKLFLSILAGVTSVVLLFSLFKNRGKK